MLWFIAFALIVVRTSEAHLHFCLDGDEQFSSFHAADVGPLCDGDQGAPGGHDGEDFDSDVFRGTLAKSQVDPTPFAALPAFDLLVLLAPERSRGEFLEVARDPQPKLPYLFLPQFRGPPV